MIIHQNNQNQLTEINFYKNHLIYFIETLVFNLNSYEVLQVAFGNCLIKYKFAASFVGVMPLTTLLLLNPLTVGSLRILVNWFKDFDIANIPPFELLLLTSVFCGDLLY